MTFEMREILRGKLEYRRRLAARPVAEKLRLLDQLRERSLVIAASRGRFVKRRQEPPQVESLLMEVQTAGPGDVVTEAWWNQVDTEVFGRPLRETGL